MTRPTPALAASSSLPARSGLVWLAIGATLGALSVGLGAIGTHSLRAHLGARELELWRTAVRYLQVHALALVGVGLVRPDRRAVRRLAGAAGTLLSGGTVLFAGSVAGLALGGPRGLGAVAPAGGALLIAGWLCLAAAALTGLRRGPAAPDSGRDDGAPHSQGPDGGPR